MGTVFKASFALLICLILQACANKSSTTTPSLQIPDEQAYSPAVTNQSYIFRSPPPGAMPAIIRAGGR